MTLVKLPVAIRDTETGLFLGRGRGTSRKWVPYLELADLWDHSGHGVNAARQSVPYSKRRALRPERFERVHVTVQAVPA